ncbi:MULTISPECIES: FAD-dependent monooxygenase [unclassified Streptomyces]|uniref:FAD-dependent monooxygenase n=1 Tax=unclassified Streptomyces TaxID=2593676 RepID=UPI000366B4D1|nr:MULTISPECIES: FAD-dependent monooxygenase [unclassified Streptomyces]MYT33332.1 pentachlorophenol monooxygenase [Streptomyces sp. SID8354]
MALNSVKEPFADTSVADALEATASGTAAATVEVLISGAGPTGLALAIDLARRGVTALLVERQPTLSRGARGTGIQPRTQEVYDDLGVLPAAQAAGGVYPPMALWEDGRIVRTHQMVERVAPTPSTPYSDALMLPQWRNVELLHARLRELGGDVRLSTELTDFTQDADGITARLTGPGGDLRTVRARYLVACDGGGSTIRKQLAVPMNGPELAPGHAILADVRLDGLDRDHWHRWTLSTGGFLGLLPLAGTDDFQMLAAAATAEPDTSPDAVRALITEHTHLTTDQVREVLWTSLYRPKAGMADAYRHGRVFLAGDAAHIHSPAGGQGLNTSVQDAYNLGWKLGQVLRHGAPDALLDTYETERRPLAARILETSTRLHRSGSLHRGRDLHQLDISYRNSPLTRELRPALPSDALTAGDRAPDAPCTTPDGTPTHLFDLLRGPHFTLLALDVPTFEPPTHTTPDLLRTLHTAGPTPDLLDPENHLHAAYGTTPTVYLIRPDGYVAVAAPPETAESAITEALETHFTASRPRITA